MFGPLLLRLRRSQRRTLRQLAASADVSRSYLNELERACRPPPPLRSPIYDRLAAALGADARTLRRAGRRDRLPMIDGTRWRERLSA